MEQDSSSEGNSPQLVKKFLLPYGTLRFIAVYTKALHWSLFRDTNMSVP
jgi:hypothetical protein